MTDDDYRTALAAAIGEYERLGAERRTIDDRLAQLAQTISTLSRLVGLTPTVPLGLTDALRLVYRNAGVPLSPTEARERLEGMGFDLSIYSNEMAAIHTVLKRLHKAGELQLVRQPGNRVYGLRIVYAWRTPPASRVITEEAAKALREHARFHTDDTPDPPQAEPR